MTSQELPELVEAWFKRDPVTGNFVQAVPPKQFTTEQIQALAEKYISLAAENERYQWQPIETAPVDTHIFVWGEALRWRGNSGRTIGYRHSDYNGHKNRVSLDGRAGGTVGFDEATHWMPLPEPPVTRKALSGGADQSTKENENGKS